MQVFSWRTPSAFHGMILSLLISLRLYAQSPPFRINLVLKERDLNELIKDIESQVPQYFFKDRLEGKEKIRVRVGAVRERLDRFLDRTMREWGIEWHKQGRSIFLTSLSAPSTDTVGSFNPKTPLTVGGEVVNWEGEAMDGISVRSRMTGKATITDAKGRFQLDKIPAGDTLVVTGVNIDSLVQPVRGQQWMKLKLQWKVGSLDSVCVSKTYYDGYGSYKRAHTTGSYATMDSEQVRQTVSPYLDPHLEYGLPGLVINHGSQGADGTSLPDQPVIRGLGTIYADASPLWVVNGMIYDGDRRQINPDDVDSVIVLKDAAAAAIWGARAANGVVNIILKQGKSAVPQVEFGTLFTFQPRPDLWNVRSLAASDEVDWEDSLYYRHFYDGNFYDPLHHSPAPPVAQLLHDAGMGNISVATANAAIAAFRHEDVRRDISKYLYQPVLRSQQYWGLGLNTPTRAYYYSLGWTHDPSSLVGAGYDRYSLHSQNTFRPNPHWQVDVGTDLTLGIQTNGSNTGISYLSAHGNKHYPAYARLVSNGQALPVYTDYDPGYLQTTAQLGFQDWTLRPVANISHEHNRVYHTNAVLNLGLLYRLRSWLDMEARYRLEYEKLEGKDLLDDAAYATRDLVNMFTQVGSNNVLSYPLPQGGIYSETHSELLGQQGRYQLDFHPVWNVNHHLSALLGAEVHSVVSTGSYFRLYGYDHESANTVLDYNTPYSQYMTAGARTIPNPSGIVPRRTDHFLSAYANLNYTHRQRYILSGSVRRDEANLFGVRTNQKGAPFWSSGLGWWIDKERFYHWKAFSSLKLRADYGYSGNIGRQASADATVLLEPNGLVGSLPTAIVQSFPNERLRWERVKIINAGIDFAGLNDRLTGTLDFYSKNGYDLMGQAPVDPTLGMVLNAGSPAYFYGNVASMKGHGFELQLVMRWLRGKFRWYTNGILSHAVTTVTQYLLPQAPGSSYLNSNLVNPVLGRPLYAVYSFRWKGLDPATGEPVSPYVQTGAKSWDTIWTSLPLDSLRYNGPAQPTYAGSLRNTWQWGRWTFSALVSYKFGYYFRRPSVNYTDLLTSWSTHNDFARRWQHPGDERFTNVPSLSYTPDQSRDNFYNFSSILVEKGDHIRLEDVTLRYDWPRGSRLWGLPFQQLGIFGDAANLGILWRANRNGIDPFYVNTPREGVRLTVGIHAIF